MVITFDQRLSISMSFKLCFSEVQGGCNSIHFLYQLTQQKICLHPGVTYHAESAKSLDKVRHYLNVLYIFYVKCWKLLESNKVTFNIIVLYIHTIDVLPEHKDG